MTPDSITDAFSGMLSVIVMMVSMAVLPGLVVGVIVAMFQAATQINEMTLSFVPKLIITLLSLFIIGPWMLTMILEYTQGLLAEIPYIIG